MRKVASNTGPLGVPLSVSSNQENPTITGLAFARRGLVAVVAVLFLCADAVAFATDQPPKHFEIKAKPLSDALMDFGAQSGLVVVAPTPLTAGKKSAAVRGDMSSMDALDRLLKGSNLTFARGADGAVVIQATAAPELPQNDVGNSGLHDDVTPEVISLQDVIVTGTREYNVQARESLMPISIVSATDLARTGATNIQDALERLVPSVSQPGVGGDTSNLIKTIRLRGLSPDQVLILVNGKRRHNSGMLNLDAGPVAGSDPVDLNMIPVSAIDHIEILEDGAAAQYGSDAIAGVINIILKSSDHGGSLTATSGAFYQGDGFQLGGTGDVGTSLGKNGFLHLSATAVHNDATNRSGPDLTITSGNPYVNKILGTPKNEVETIGFNAGETLDNNVELYAFGTGGHRDASSFESHHVSDGIDNGGIVNAPAFYPNGYIPEETISEYDFSLTGGVRGKDLAGWHWDLSSTYGRDDDRFGLTHSLNQSLGLSSPTSFHIGDSIASQWTSNLDLTRSFPIAALAAPLAVAAGIEQRHETYQIKEGDLGSYVQGTVNPTGRPGSIGDFGVMPSVAASSARNSISAYVDLAATILPKWRTDLAGRFEHYSDFGNTGTGKFSTRYDFSDDLGLRATVQSGFRAPSLAQENYALTQTGPSLFPGGPHLVQIQYPVDSPGALALGSRPLKAERSESFSVGLVAEPITDLRITIDAYQINLHDRITNSGLLFLGFNQTGTAFDVGSFFTNSLSTRSRGVDLTSKYATQLGDSWGLIRWSLNATYNKTTITRITPTPAALQALGLTLFDPETLANITSATPNAKAILGADYVNGKWTVTVHETLLGDAHSYATADFVNYSYERFSFHAMTDLELSYEATHHVTLTVGASNLFNVYPNRVNPADMGLSTGAIYPTWSPININGGFYYGRVAIGF